MRKILLLIATLAFSINAEGQPYGTQRQQANAAQEMASAQCAPYRNPALTSHVDALCKGNLIKALTSLLNQTFNLPKRLSIIGRECGQSNASYNPSRVEITLCYELSKEISDRIRREIRADINVQNQVALGALVFIFLHEVGHAVIDLYDLPVLGRQEDAADQVGTYLLLAMAEERPDIAGYWPAGAHWYFRKTDLFFSKRHYADEHSLNPQRQFNIACWVFGSNPQKYMDFAKNVGLPVQRAQRCPNEYKELQQAVNKMLSPHFNQAFNNSRQRGVISSTQSYGGDANLPGSSGRGAQTVPESNCAPAKHATVPVMTGLTYHQARVQLLAEGWQPLPIRSPSAAASDRSIYSGNGAIFLSNGYGGELESCAGAGNAACSMLFRDVYGNRLRVITVGEEIPAQNAYARVEGFGFTCKP